MALIEPYLSYKDILETTYSFRVSMLSNNNNTSSIRNSKRPKGILLKVDDYYQRDD
jgi:hypothetical protein